MTSQQLRPPAPRVTVRIPSPAPRVVNQQTPEDRRREIERLEALAAERARQRNDGWH